MSIASGSSGDCSDTKIRVPLRATSAPLLWPVSYSSSKPSAFQNATLFPQLCVSMYRCLTPSIVMGYLLAWFGRWTPHPGEVIAQRVGDERRERLLGVDREVLDITDQRDGQVHVELLDLLVHTSMLAS